MCLVAWAREVAELKLRELPTRLAHTAGVVRRANLLAKLWSSSDGEVLVAAAYVHDVGYAPDIQRTGFHPLDGAYFLRELGYRRLASLVAFHSTSRLEAELRGLAPLLSAFEREPSVVADGLTYCDMTTGINGEQVTLADRIADIQTRHGSDSLVAHALSCARPELERAISSTEALLRR